MIRNGFYIIKDSFFSDMSDPYLKGNKKQNRPHYYCFEDSNYNGIYWMIPLSSRIDKYKKIVSKRTGKGRTCDIIHIVKLDDNHESAFLIQDMFPISEKYIEREYTIAGNHLRLTSEHAAKEIEQKAEKFRQGMDNEIIDTIILARAKGFEVSSATFHEENVDGLSLIHI